MIFFVEENIKQKYIEYINGEINIINDFLFFIDIFISLLLHRKYIKRNRKKNKIILGKYICILSFICYKYIILFYMYLKDNVFYYNYSDLIILEEEEEDEEFTDDEENEEDIDIEIDDISSEEEEENEELIQKILICKKVSRTRKKGRVGRFKVVLLLYDSKKSWFGLGSSKDFYLQDAISKARLKALENIYSVNILLSNKIEYYPFIKKENNSIYIKNKYCLFPSFSSFVGNISFIRGINISIEGKKTINILKLIKLVLT